MDNDKMMAAIMALPDADLMTETKLTDPVGSGAYYSAGTVVRLLAAERETLQTVWEDTRTQRDELMAHIKDRAPLPEWATKWIAACKA